MSQSTTITSTGPILACEAVDGWEQTMPCNCGGTALHLEHAKTGEHAFACSSPACEKVTSWFREREDAVMAWELHDLVVLN